MLEILKAILFGIVEGITEWLPVSSTGHLILLEEAMIFGRAGDLQRAEQAFNQYYDSCAQEYRGHEGWKSYQYLRAHLNYLAELAEALHFQIHNPV